MMSKLTDNKTPANSNGSPPIGPKKPRKLKPRPDLQGALVDYEEFEDGAEEQPAKSKSSYHTADNTLNEERREKLLADMPRAQQRGPLVPQYILLITANATDATVLAQIVYWLGEGRGKQPRKGVPCRWTAQTSAELGRQLGRTEDEIDKSLSRLKKQGFAKWKIKMFQGKRQRHLWIDWEQIAKAYQQVKENQKDDEDQ